MIELRELSKHYPGPDGGTRALDAVTLDLPADECVAIVGPSGSGKPTLINLIAAIDRPSAGQVRVGGTAVHALDESRLAGVFAQAQSRGLVSDASAACAWRSSQAIGEAAASRPANRIRGEVDT